VCSRVVNVGATFLFFAGFFGKSPVCDGCWQVQHSIAIKVIRPHVHVTTPNEPS
jgi:hypothetical protein